jgi:hypothetical protein
MYDQLKDIMDNNRIGDFLFPSLPAKIKGKISFLSREMVVVDAEEDGETYQYVTHPNNICIVQKKAA